MIITIEPTRYARYALFSEYSDEYYHYFKLLQSSLGWQNFSWKDGKWRWADPEVICMIRAKYPNVILDPTVAKEVEVFERRNVQDIERDKKVREIKEAKDSILVIPEIKGELYPYQKVGIEFFINSRGKAILCDSPGLGKTAQALGYIVHSKILKTLVVCPASVKFSWEDEVEKWTNLKSYVVGSGHLFEDIPSGTNIVITNYEALKKNLKSIIDYKFDCIVGDESHYIKSETAIRSKAFKMIARGVRHVILMTGTPILSRPIELFNMLNIIDPRTWNSWFQYAVRYAGGKNTYWGFEAKGATNLEELSSRINGYFLRRTKDEVLRFLPPKNRITVPLELAKRHRDEYKTALNDLGKYLRDNKGSDKPEIIRALQNEKLVRLNYLRQITAMGKIEGAKELIESIIESGEKVLVFSSFNAPLKALQDHFPKESVLLVGETPVEKRGDIVRDFQENPETKIFLGGFKSGGIGITLTAASNVIFCDYSWNPADHQQAEDRLHRPGQTATSINIYQLSARGTIDGRMKKLLDKKQAIFDKLIEGKADEQTNSVINEMVEIATEE